MPVLPDVAGNAALAICESLLLALNDREILPEHEIVGVLKDAAAAHENAPPGDGIEEMHKAVAELINKSSTAEIQSAAPEVTTVRSATG